MVGDNDVMDIDGQVVIVTAIFLALVGVVAWMIWLLAPAVAESPDQYAAGFAANP